MHDGVDLRLWQQLRQKRVADVRPDELGKPNRVVLLTASVPQVKKKRGTQKGMEKAVNP